MFLMSQAMRPPGPFPTRHANVLVSICNKLGSPVYKHVFGPSLGPPDG
jgi:hypothetical protein